MERLDGILWRIARLHPGLMWLLYFVATLISSGVDGILSEDAPALSTLVGLLILLLWASYPLFVVAVLFRESASPPARLKRAVAAFAFVGVSVVVLSLFSYLTRSGTFEIPLGLQQSLSASVVLVFAALFYLWGAASVQLVEAERGPNRSGGSVFGAWLLFFYLPFFGVYFVHRRVRRLASNCGKETGPPLSEAARVPERAGEA